MSESEVLVGAYIHRDSGDGMEILAYRKSHGQISMTDENDITDNNEDNPKHNYPKLHTNTKANRTIEIRVRAHTST